MRALVTGITGFVGGHLTEHLLDQGDAVVGCSRTGTWPTGLEHLSNRAALLPCDLTDSDAVRALVAHSAFDCVFHLAGLANPRACRADPALAHRTNVLATEILYDAICQSGQRPVILFVSTAYVYGPHPNELPIRSTLRVSAHDPYAASKWAAEQVSVRVATDHGLSIQRIRTFNHVGPRQPAGFIVSDWALQIAAIEAGRVPAILRVGNIDTRRDYSDVRDIVRAYRLLACEPRASVPGVCQVFNLGSGTSRSGRDILERFRTISRTLWNCEIDAQFFRPGEAVEIVADATPLRELTGWRPEIDFDDTLRDTLEYWRRHPTALASGEAGRAQLPSGCANGGPRCFS